MDKVLKQIETFLRGLSWRQRILIGVGAALVVGVIALFVRLSESADFKPLYSGLSPEDAQAVVQSLSDEEYRLPALHRRHQHQRPGRPDR